MKKDIKSAFVMLMLTVVICGGAYPLFALVIAQFSEHPYGDVQLIGQQFTQDKYFWGRPSASNWNAAKSGASNASVTTEEYKTAIAERVKKVEAGGASIPSDIVTASASGIDPHISPDAALYQAPRVAKARKMSVEELMVLIAKNTEGKTLGVFGQERVNVLRLNIALDNAM